jgi:hypothetical protein
MNFVTDHGHNGICVSNMIISEVRRWTVEQDIANFAETVFGVTHF